MRVLIHHPKGSTWREELSQRLPGSEIVLYEDDSDTPADYLATSNPPAEVFDKQKGIKGIFALAAGVDALLANPALPRDVPLIKLGDAGMAPLMIDYVRYGVLYFQRNFDRYLFQEESTYWRSIPSPDKSEWPITVLGLGSIGCQVAQALAEDGFPVYGWSRSPKSINGVVCHYGTEGLQAVLAKGRTVVILLPATSDTRQIVNKEFLDKLPKDATLINPARGSLVDERALLEALGPGSSPKKLRGAILDVFSNEPLPSSSPLWQHPRVRVTPHAGATTPIPIASDQVAERIKALENGESVKTVDVSNGY